MSNDKFDEYKLFVESAQHLSERRQAATQTYLTVNTSIFAILALLVKEAGLSGSMPSGTRKCARCSAERQEIGSG